MERRHLRYFVAVARSRKSDGGSDAKIVYFTAVAQPQIRDLGNEVGDQRLTGRARGIELRPSGRAFLDHARLVLSQAEAASDAARPVAHSRKPCFMMGFLTGHQLSWMPEALRILRDELPNIDVILKRLLSSSNQLVARVSKKTRSTEFLAFLRLLQFISRGVGSS